MKLILALPLAALLALTACGGSDGDDDTASSAPVITTPKVKTYCPNVAVLQQAQTLVTFLPGRSDIAAQVANASITGISGSCVPADNNLALRIRFQANFSVTNGPAGHSAPITLPYFVSISEGDAIFWKELHSITLNFHGSAGSGYSPPLTVNLPNTLPSSSIDVLVGFQLTPGQIPAAAAAAQ